MKTSSLAFLVLAFALALPAQEPSKNDLRRVLHADVKDYGNDGRLIAIWPFKQPNEMVGFEAAPSVKLLPNDGLCLSPEPKNGSGWTFKELELEQPCKISFELRLDAADSAYVASFGNPSKPDERVNVGINAPIFRGDRNRYEFIGRMVNAAYDDHTSTKVSCINRGAWTPLTIDWRKDRVSLVVGKSETCMLPDAAIKRFNVTFGATGGKVLVRNFAVDTQVNRDSMRKLYRSVNVSEAPSSKPAEADAEAENAWEKIASEESEDGFDAAAMAELKSLPEEVQNALQLGRKTQGMNATQAEQAFDKAIQLAPGAGMPLWFRAEVAAEEGEGRKALELYERAVATNPKLQCAWISLAKSRAERQQPEKALEALAQAEALDPTDPWIHVYRAELHLSATRLDDALKEIEKAVVKRGSSEGLKLLASQLRRLRIRPDWKPSYPKSNEFFELETSISGKVAAELAQSLLQYRRFLVENFPIGAKQTMKSQVLVFDSASEYHRFAALAGSDIDNSVGVYNRLTKTLLLTSKVSAATTQQILFHEAFHQYLDLVAHRPPIWLDEGLAEFYGATTFDVSNKAKVGGILHDRLLTLKRGRLIPAAALMNMSQSRFMHPAAVGVHYAESWALVHFFKMGGVPTYSKLFDDYCKAVIKGESQSAAFEGTFGKDEATMDRIEQAFGVYVRGTLLRSK